MSQRLPKRAEFLQALREEGAQTLFALRTACAVLLALGLAFRLDLDRPGSAAVTVLIVSLSQAGMVLEKSFYRILGTVAGGTAAVVFVMLFAQQRLLFTVAVAVWVGLAVVGSSWYRSFRAYAFILAGYTVCLVGFPAVETPALAYHVAIDRVAVVSLGILCGGLLSVLVFPRSTVSSLIGLVRGQVCRFLTLCQQVLTTEMTSGALREAHMSFAGDVVNLELLRGGSHFEAPDSRLRSGRLRRLNADFMQAVTSLHSYHRVRRAMPYADDQSLLLLDSMAAELDRALRTVTGGIPASAQEAVPVASRLRELLSNWDVRVEATLASLSQTLAVSSNEALLAAMFQLRQFGDEVLAYMESYAALSAAQDAVEREIPPTASQVDPLLASLAGLRAFSAVLAVGVFWIASDWTYGFYAIMLAAVGSSLFAASPDPVKAAVGMSKGFALGFLAAVAFYGLVLPRMDGFLLLAVSMLPFLLIGTRWMARQETAGIGTGFGLMLLTGQNLTNTMTFDMTQLFNQSLATFIGLGAAILAYAVFMPPQSRWVQRRVRHSLIREVGRALSDEDEHARARFESRVRDRLAQILTQPMQGEAIRNRWVDEGLTVLAAGLALLQLRDENDPVIDAGFLSQVAAAMAFRADFAVGDILPAVKARRLQLAQALQGADVSAARRFSALLALELALLDWDALATPDLTLTAVEGAIHAS
ncbi:FUSC family protein [Mangrovitalea sediminis]|uniref:FUSC family protein n=1 Tax=Mangrovitalea sediminis TaxID=1982043 RepID=UPI000BE5D363|nr:FUSC family protein [Mangrovitalea sediminis]